MIEYVFVGKVLSRNIWHDKPRCEHSEQPLDISLLLYIEHPYGKARRISVLQADGFFSLTQNVNCCNSSLVNSISL